MCHPLNRILKTNYEKTFMCKFSYVSMTAIFKNIAVDGFFEFQKTTKDAFSKNPYIRS